MYRCGHADTQTVLAKLRYLIGYNLDRSLLYATPLGSTEGLAFNIPAATFPPATGLVSLLAPGFTVKVALGKPSRFGLPVERISKPVLP